MLCKKRGPNAFVKSIDACQPAQSAQADMHRYVLLLVNLIHVQGPLSPGRWLSGELVGLMTW